MAQNEITRIEYQSATRTFREQIIVTSDSTISVEENFRKSPKPVTVIQKTSASEWKRLTGALHGVTPEELGELKSPSDKRTYDAAAHSSITITVKGSKSYSHGFDDTDPHEKLKPLLKAILDQK